MTKQRTQRECRKRVLWNHGPVVAFWHGTEHRICPSMGRSNSGYGGYCFVEGQLKLLVIIKRKAHPFRNKYALVGGFCGQAWGLSIKPAFAVKEEVDLECRWKRWSSWWQSPLQDAIRGWVITIAHQFYLGNRYQPSQGWRWCRKSLSWCGLTRQRSFRDGERLLTEDFAFDHYQILLESIKRIQGATGLESNFLHLPGRPLRVRKELSWSISSRLSPIVA